MLDYRITIVLLLFFFVSCSKSSNKIIEYQLVCNKAGINCDKLYVKDSLILLTQNCGMGENSVFAFKLKESHVKKEFYSVDSIYLKDKYILEPIKIEQKATDKVIIFFVSSDFNSMVAIEKITIDNKEYYAESSGIFLIDKKDVLLYTPVTIKTNYSGGMICNTVITGNTEEIAVVVSKNNNNLKSQYHNFYLGNGSIEFNGSTSIKLKKISTINLQKLRMLHQTHTGALL